MGKPIFIHGMIKNLLKRIFGRRIPSEGRRHAYRMFLQYKFIPGLVMGIPMRRLGATELMMIDTWPGAMKRIYGRKFYLEWDEFKCKELYVDDEHIMIVYIFPEPILVPEAAYGAVLINTSSKMARYFTLELSFDNVWIIGTQTAERHYSICPMDNPSFDNFVGWVSEQAHLV